MPWMTTGEAVAALGCSERTLRRRVRAGELETRREGRRLLVNVPHDGMGDTVTGQVRQLTDLTTAVAVQRAKDAEITSATMAALDRAENRALSAVRWSVCASSGLGIVAVSCLLLGAWQYGSREVEHAATVATLESERASLEHRHAQTVTTLEANADTATREAQTASERADALADQVQQLRLRNARLHKADELLGYVATLRAALWPWAKPADAESQYGGAGESQYGQPIETIVGNSSALAEGR